MMLFVRPRPVSLRLKTARFSSRSLIPLEKGHDTALGEKLFTRLLLRLPFVNRGHRR